MAKGRGTTRRVFLKGAAAGAAGLVIGMRLPVQQSVAVAQATEPFAPNAFLRIGQDGIVTVISKHIEFGQGTFTGIATILAEELDADWSSIRVESAPANVKLYGNNAWGRAAQGTGGSTSIANSWDELRKAGAEARA